MIAVVDTDVLAYTLLGTQPFVDEVRRFWRSGAEVCAPDSWRVELANVLWMAVRAGVIDRAGAQRRFRRGESLVALTVGVRALRAPALALAISRGHPVYDTLFVALALREGVPLVTFDRRLLERFPGVAVRPHECG